ncbi:F-box protein [Salix suchowensis]|nr:F-box protein [Salix suchowensis]
MNKNHYSPSLSFICFPRNSFDNHTGIDHPDTIVWKMISSVVKLEELVGYSPFSSIGLASWMLLVGSSLKHLELRRYILWLSTYQGKEQKSFALPVLISDGLGTKGSKSQGDGQTDDRTVADKEIPINAVSESGEDHMLCVGGWRTSPSTYNKLHPL